MTITEKVEAEFELFWSAIERGGGAPPDTVKPFVRAGFMVGTVTGGYIHLKIAGDVVKVVGKQLISDGYLDQAETVCAIARGIDHLKAHLRTQATMIANADVVDS